MECERVWQHSLIDGVQLTLAPCLDDFRIRCAPVLIEQLVSLSRVVSSRRTGRPQVFGRVSKRKSEATRSLVPAKPSRESLCQKIRCVCVRRRRWSIILPEVYHVLKLTRRSAKSDLGVSATCAKPALTSPRAEESRVANLSHGTRSSSALPYGRL